MSYAVAVNSRNALVIDVKYDTPNSQFKFTPKLIIQNKATHAK